METFDLPPTDDGFIQMMDLTYQEFGDDKVQAIFIDDANHVTIARCNAIQRELAARGVEPEKPYLVDYINGDHVGLKVLNPEERDLEEALAYLRHHKYKKPKPLTDAEKLAKVREGLEVIRGLKEDLIANQDYETACKLRDALEEINKIVGDA